MRLGLGLALTSRARAGEPAPVYPIVQKTRGFSVGFLSDTHLPRTPSAAERVRTCLDWIQANATGLVAVVNSGDMNVAPGADPQFGTWIRQADGGNLAPDVTFLPVPGNHDAEVPWNGPYGETPDQPHATLQAEHAALFQGREWYVWDHEALRIIVLNNLTDYLADAGASMYYNVNPPGNQYELNPDHGGITVEGSAQRLWLESVVGSSHPWKIVCCHRPMWAPFDEDPRKLHRAMRPIMAPAIDAGVSLFASGDVHVDSVSGPWYPTPPDYEEYRAPGSVGAYAMTVCGGYAVREVDETVLPDHANTVHYAAGLVSGLATGAILQFEGDWAWLRLFSCSGLDPVGAEVWSGTLVRNPGS